jgi:hypothetical protein
MFKSLPQCLAQVYVVLELMTGGELFEKIALDGPLPEAAGRRVFQQLLDGLAHCHAHGVYHRCAAVCIALYALDCPPMRLRPSLGPLQPLAASNLPSSGLACLFAGIASVYSQVHTCTLQ